MRCPVLLSIVLFGWAGSVFAVDRVVTRFEDEDSEGTLRSVLRDACDDAGDDTIRFAEPHSGDFRIVLNEPLVVPADCLGRITLEGRTDVETILDATEWYGEVAEPGELCALHVYSDGNMFRRLVFAGTARGSGLCFFGRNNRVEFSTFGTSRIGIPLSAQQYAVVVSDIFSSTDPGMDGRGSVIVSNTIASGWRSAVWIHADGATVERNDIRDSESIIATIAAYGDDNRFLRNEIHDNDGDALLLFGNNLVVDGNTLRSNTEAGIRAEGNDLVIRHNRISGGQEREYDEERPDPDAVVGRPAPGMVLRGDDLTIEDNRIEDNEGDGIWASGSGSVFRRNRIARHRGRAMDAEREPAGLAVWGDNITIEENTTGENEGSGIRAHGLNNMIATNRILENGAEGVRAEIDNSIIRDNEILGNGGHGVYLFSANSDILGNEILGNGGCPGERLVSHDLPCLEASESEGAGIRIATDSRYLVIGGEEFGENSNFIQYNRGGGIVVAKDADIEQVRITHNIISRNYGDGPDIDLGNNGVTENDLLDEDEGPNHYLNFIDTVQSFPLVPSPEGGARFWSWGIAEHGREIELYGVSHEDSNRGIVHGGADLFLVDAAIVQRTFAGSFSLDESLFPFMTVLSRDLVGNTSEFSWNFPVGEDVDLDGIPDRLEAVGDSEEDEKTDAEAVDTDDDGLADGVEDRDHHGNWNEEKGETSGYLADSDGDGLFDGAEVHWDGAYDEGLDTDPLNPDTDGDTLLDGFEDSNNNGICEAYLGETNPKRVDSDGDGFADNVDSCPFIFNPGREPWYCNR